MISIANFYPQHKNTQKTPLKKVSFCGIKLSPKEIEHIVELKGCGANLNTYLRYGKEGLKPYHYKPMEWIYEVRDGLDSLFKKCQLDNDETVYRFCLDPNIKPGIKTYKDKAFLSTCKRTEKVEQMLRMWPYDYSILRIKLPKGTPAIDVEKALNKHDNEAEIILPRDLNFKVKSFNKVSDYFSGHRYEDDPRLVLNLEL